MATFYALKRKPELVFWAPGPPKCAFGARNQLFANKHTFLLQVCFLAQKWLLGPKCDSGWFGWKYHQFGAGIHRVSLILRIPVSPWCKKWNSMKIHKFMLFDEKWILFCFMTFYIISWNPPSVFCNPSTAFRPRINCSTHDLIVPRKTWIFS